MSKEHPKSVTNFVIGLEILSKYMKNGMETEYFIGAEHDQLFIYTENSPGELTADGQMLETLGFFYDDNVEVWSYYT